MTLDTCEIQTPVGTLWLAAAGEKLVALEFASRAARRGAVRRKLEARFGALEMRRHRDPAGAVTRLKRYFAGDTRALDDQPLDALGTEFQRRVWRKLREIPAGATRSYAEMAWAIGRPRAVRAVGAANGANPVALFVPCHRVVASDGSLHGYGGGLERKRWLLAHEGARRT
jgi:methylated-DNA-[protein]-cysteine S-methyltransferase